MTAAVPAANGRIVCQRCIHYHVTWDPAAPHGCRAMGFKSLMIPAVLVRRNSGQPCQAYQPKSASAARNGGGPGGGMVG